MSQARIVTTIRSTVSTDLDQRDIVNDGKVVMDDATQVAAESRHLLIPPLGSVTFTAAALGATRFGFIQVETDAPIRFVPQGAGAIPISPLLQPPLSIGLSLTGPTIQPAVQPGVLSLRCGVVADNPTDLLDTFTLVNPAGGQAASVKVIMAGGD